ncbi:actin-like protein arp8 [Linnemannia gamsii]|uniref:Actin-like protein arp8 n=1 Tax=Linnemannia gamsii TaxID=64522 RepID=A0ABQ7KBD4_9FUNG|nr:actin-like protein arp8 [Linnemannia gamsii]
MEDVNMEDAGPSVNEHTEQGASSEQHPSSTSAQTTAGQQEPHPDTAPAARGQNDTTDAITSTTTTNQTNADINVDVQVDQSLNSSKNTETTTPTASETASAPETSTLNTNADTLDNSEKSVAATATSTAQEDQKDEDSAMDVDSVPPVITPSTVVDAGVQDHPMDSQPTEQTASAQPTTSSADVTVAGSSEVQPNVGQGRPSEMSTESTLTTPATTAETVKLEGNGESVPESVPAADASSLTTVPTNAATEGEAASSSTAGEHPETTATTEAQTEPEAPPGLPPKPVYVPQFKFTTFAPMTPIPVRNITNTFQKTDKNYVLKELAAGKQRRRKRKAEQADGEASSEAKPEGEAQENGSVAADAEGESPTVEGESGILKRKRGDELLAIRKGIFADEGDIEEEADKENQENGEIETKDANEDEESDEFSSDSDSEESVMNEMDENGETRSSADMGKKVIVIHPGSRFLRIGRASDAYPIITPHCIARRIRVPPPLSTITNGSAKPTGGSETAAESQGEGGASASTGEETAEADQDKDQAMDVDDDDDDEDEDSSHSPVPDVVNDRYLQEIEYDLKMRMKAAKRKPVNNAKTQVRSFNTSTRPERILDHNDPYKVEWTDPAVEGEYIIGQRALNLPQGKHHNFKLFWPIVGGKLNETDYVTPRVVVSDLETIWTKVIQEDLGIEPKQFRKYYAVLVIPDHYSKIYVTELIGMLLRSMQFRGVMVQQESVCASFGAGVSAACVVDIGAEVTKIACVEDGICIPNSRAVLKYGGDDITRCFAALVNRTGFPYQELDLSQTYDWRLMEELKEKWCTMNEADLTVQVYNFFVRRPEKQTEKYQVKVYDEVALSPMCLFFPGVIRRWIEERETKPAFTKLINHEDINDEDAPPIALMNQTSKKSTAAAAAAAAAAARAGTPSLTAPGEENAQTSQAATPNATPAQTPAPSALATTSTPAPAVGTPAPSAVVPAVVVSAEPPVIPFAMEPSVRTTDKAWETAGVIGKDHFSSLVALDVVVAQCISNCGSEERSKKLYGSIILVGGGGMIQGFDRVLEDRLFQALPATLTTVEKVEVLPAPREMDPRLLVWKGGSVLGKLDSARELWIKPLEWELLGRKVLRDKALFVWSSKD